MAGALDDLGISSDGRVATFGWNTARHLGLYFAAPCSGRVLHTLNIRLFPEQLTYVVNHAEDEIIFVDRSLVGLLWPLLRTFETVRHVVVADDGRGERPDDAGSAALHDYEELVAAAQPAEWPRLDENRAASMCYTSGTTGNPKGVVYSHRSTWLHTISVTTADSIGACERDTILPVVPMFHANAWGLAHAGVAVGANLVMPGPDLSPPGAGRRSSSPSRSRWPPACPPSGWGSCPSWPAATPPTCGPSPVGDRPCRGRCRRATASSWGSRSCRPGA